MSPEYIQKHFDDIKQYANIIEKRLDDTDCNIDLLLKDNKIALKECRKYKLNYILIKDKYDIDEVKI